MANTLNISNVSAVIFDLDGLLIDSESASRECWYEAAGQHGFNLDTIYTELIGKGADHSDQILATHFGPSFPIKELRKLKNDLYAQKASTTGIPLKPGVKELLDCIKRKEIKIALATGSFREVGLRRLEENNISRYFDTHAFGDEVKFGKPAPDIFLLAATRLGCSASNCIVIEDSHSGVEAALQANMRVIMVPDLIPPSQQISDSAVPVLQSLNDLVPFFQ